MKKIILAFGFVFFLISCGNNTSSDPTKEEHAGNSDKPSAIDTTQHATGITNQNVISTDTAAMSVDSFKR